MGVQEGLAGRDPSEHRARNTRLFELTQQQNANNNPAVIQEHPNE